MKEEYKKEPILHHYQRMCIWLLKQIFNFVNFVRSINSNQNSTDFCGCPERLVKGHPSTYDAQYSYSQVENNYSIDLNALPLLVDMRTDVQLAMNMYAQLAGVIGARYPYFLQDADYGYDYLFDADGRLVQIVQTPTSLKPDKQVTYWFMLHYADLNWTVSGWRGLSMK